MRDRYSCLVAAVVAVALTFSVSMVFVSAQGAQSKAPAPAAAPAARGQTACPRSPHVARHRLQRPQRVARQPRQPPAVRRPLSARFVSTESRTLTDFGRR